MLLINLLGVTLIGFIIWWFWLYKPDSKVMSDENIIVEVKDGVYTPSSIRIPAGKNIALRFLRKDPSPCSEILQIPSLGISKTLPLDEITKVQLKSVQAGEHEFHCQMQMYRGVIVAK
ncbi:cupredoxin domain-containing protein [Thalassotalea sp. Y01]|uniref:cupredoxin domain-containing protein n=1 Tax=Thalassotalea sp. Y01 TaxID=2729613 RepID=UPI00145CBE79|nr:cupredoxin domain-containing protein [Thalassotalea sp. Y01]NMP14966.1 cupredoxin domain-containing protein [Thalassotalea sp. Y01]